MPQKPKTRGVITAEQLMKEIDSVKTLTSQHSDNIEARRLNHTIKLATDLLGNVSKEIDDNASIAPLQQELTQFLACLRCAPEAFEAQPSCFCMFRGRNMGRSIDGYREQFTDALYGLLTSVSVTMGRRSAVYVNELSERLSKLALALPTFDFSIKTMEEALIAHLQAERLFYGHECEENHYLAMKKYLEAAEFGYAPSMLRVFKCYREGIGCTASISNALKYLDKAVEEEYAPALSMMGELYDDGIPEYIDIDLAKAQDFFKKAMEGGDLKAVVELGLLFEQYARSSFECYRKMLLKENFKGIFTEKGYFGSNLSEIPEFEGINDVKTKYTVPPTNTSEEMKVQVQSYLSQAIRYYDEASRRGSLTAFNNLGVIFSDLEPMVDKSLLKKRQTAKEYREEIAFDNYTRASSRGLAVATFHLAQYYLDGKACIQSTVQALDRFKEALEQGYIVDKCCVQISVCLTQLNRADEAVSYLRRAVDLGNPNACYLLAQMYSKGKGVEISSATALSLLEKGGKLNQVDCLLELGNIYFSGLLGMKPYAAAAFHYYEKAALIGSSEAMNALALLLETSQDIGSEDYPSRMFFGNLSKEDRISHAIFWYKQAKLLENSDAIANLADLLYKLLYSGEVHLTPERICIVEKLVENHSNFDKADKLLELNRLKTMDEFQPAQVRRNTVRIEEPVVDKEEEPEVEEVASVASESSKEAVGVKQERRVAVAL
ncbi:hypothetical protein PCE1_000445 [Barthelona sp. PCE]